MCRAGSTLRKLRHRPRGREAGIAGASAESFCLSDRAGMRCAPVRHVPTQESFRDLEVWQEAMTLAEEIYALITVQRQLPRTAAGPNYKLARLRGPARLTVRGTARSAQAEGEVRCISVSTCGWRKNLGNPPDTRRTTCSTSGRLACTNAARRSSMLCLPLSMPTISTCVRTPVP